VASGPENYRDLKSNKETFEMLNWIKGVFSKKPKEIKPDVRCGFIALMDMKKNGTLPSHLDKPGKYIIPEGGYKSLELPSWLIATKESKRSSDEL
jgi:hypothetical protein